MENRAHPLSEENLGVQEEHNYCSNIIIRDMAEELLEEDTAQMTETKTGLTEVLITIEGKDYKTLIDMGSEISVVSENVLGELQRVNKNIPLLPVAGVTVVGVTGVRSKRVTKQVQLNVYINGIEFENTFLVVKGLNLDIILGNDFLERNKAVIDFNQRIVEFNKGHESILSLIHI